MTLPEILECAHVRPEDRLVLRVAGSVSEEELADWQRQIQALGWERGKVLIVTGEMEMLVVEGAHA